MKRKRPVNLKLTTIRLPLTAYMSIMHRISGFVLLFVTGILLFLLNKSLTYSGFKDISDALKQPVLKFIVWVLLLPLIFHFIAGIRHLLMDMGIAEGIQSGKKAAFISFVLAVILSLLWGVWLW